MDATPMMLRPREVCDELRISRATFYRLVGRGELPAKRVGGQLRVPRTELGDYLRRRTTRRDA